MDIGQFWLLVQIEQSFMPKIGLSPCVWVKDANMYKNNCDTCLIFLSNNLIWS